MGQRDLHGSLGWLEWSYNSKARSSEYDRWRRKGKGHRRGGGEGGHDGGKVGGGGGAVGGGRTVGGKRQAPGAAPPNRGI